MELKTVHYAEQLLEDAKFEETLEIVNSLLESPNFPPQEALKCSVLKSKALVKLGKYETAISIADTVYNKLKDSTEDFWGLDALITKIEAHFRLGNVEETSNLILQGERYVKKFRHSEKKLYERQASLFNYKGAIFHICGDLEQALQNYQHSLSLGKKIGDKKKISTSYNNIGVIYNLLGKFKEALEYYHLSLEIFQELKINREISASFNNIGEIYRLKGELNVALEYYQSSLSLKEEINDKRGASICHNNIGEIYRNKGEYETATLHLETSILLFKEIGNKIYMSEPLFRLIEVSLDQNDIKSANTYLEQLNLLSESEPANRIINQRKSLAQALLLLKGKRKRGRIQAEEILQKIINDEIADHSLTVITMIKMCELLLLELKTTNELEVLSEVKELLKKLQILAQDQHSFSLVVNTLLLRAKLAAIDGELQQALQLFDQAKITAEEKDLGNLGQIIQEERRILEVEFERWQELIQRSTPSLRELEQARLIKYLEEAQKLVNSLRL